VTKTAKRRTSVRSSLVIDITLIHVIIVRIQVPRWTRDDGDTIVKSSRSNRMLRWRGDEMLYKATVELFRPASSYWDIEFRLKFFPLLIQ